jgi:hypothetical protein
MLSLRTSRPVLLYCALLFLLITYVQAQDCSKLNPCATGCCSKFGYCGTGDDFCGSGNCVDTCDFKLGCDKNNPCKIGCCSKFGFCGLGPDCKTISILLAMSNLLQIARKRIASLAVTASHIATLVSELQDSPKSKIVPSTFAVPSMDSVVSLKSSAATERSRDPHVAHQAG